jgi:hypothetical protein
MGAAERSFGADIPRLAGANAIAPAMASVLWANMLVGESSVVLKGGKCAPRQEHGHVVDQCLGSGCRSE